jgi:hypothetical protein
MLQDLPLELLVLISCYLTLPQKVTCRQVCRRWAKVIKESCFLEHVVLDQQEDYFDLMELVEEETLHGNQVKTLVLNECGLAPIDVFTLADVFPNLVELEWNDKQEVLLSELTINDHENIMRWGTSLQSITMRTPYPSTAQILQTTTFASLTRLTVGFVDPHDEIGKMQLLYALKHAPILATMTLDGVGLTVENMELLHANTPELTSLTLSHTELYRMLRRDFGPILDEETGRFRFDLKAAPKVKSFQFVDESSFNDHESYWLKYMMEKYPELQHLHIDCQLPEVRVVFVEDSFNFTDTFNEGLLRLISGCHKLTSFHVNHIPITSTIYDALDQNNIQLHEVTINQYDDPAPLQETLEDPVWHTRFQQLKRLNVYQCLQQPFSTNNQLLPQLVHLAISYTTDMVDEILYVDQLLFCLPLLNTLTITDHCTLDAKQTTKTALVPHKLEQFTISNCTFSRNLISFINHCCYLVTQLSFIKAVPVWINPFEILLPNLDLHTLRLESHQSFKVQICTDNKCCLKPALKSNQASKLASPERLSQISIRSRRIQHLYVNDIARY